MSILYVVVPCHGRQIVCPCDPKSKAVCSYISCRAIHSGKVGKEGPEWMQPTSEDPQQWNRERSTWSQWPGLLDLTCLYLLWVAKKGFLAKFIPQSCPPKSNSHSPGGRKGIKIEEDNSNAQMWVGADYCLI